MDLVAREPVCVCVSVPVVRVLQLNGNSRNSPKLVADLTPRASDGRSLSLLRRGVSAASLRRRSAHGTILEKRAAPACAFPRRGKRIGGACLLLLLGLDLIAERRCHVAVTQE